MSEREERLTAALADIVRHPVATLVVAWSWKSAAISAALRSLIFLITNLRTGHGQAVRAMLVEAAFAIFASGFLGATVQRVRSARPAWLTAVAVWLALPLGMTAAQYGVHRLGGTQHVRAGLIVSFLFAALASGFTWFAMRRGVLLAAQEQSSVAGDARKLPGIVLDFILALPRALAGSRR